MTTNTDAPRREYVDGTTAIVRGAIDAGCTFFAGYPITPASGILMSMMREIPKVDGVAIQGEDEIASIGMCLGAAMSGAKAMTATSGPGISLYSENIGLAIMGEVPLVIVDVQRLGPATGGATTVAQGDVQFVRWSTGGGYPVIVLAPSGVPESYSLTVKAFELAERFRCPVFLLTDKELAMTLSAVDVDEYMAVHGVERTEKHEGLPYSWEPSGAVEPMRRYGEGDAFRFTGSTHDEGGYITKNAAKVGSLNEHLIAKIEDHRGEIEMVDADLDPGADTIVLSYGVTAGAARAAVARLRAGGVAVSCVVVQSLWPIPATALDAAFEGIDRIVVPELNMGLYSREIERIAAGKEIVGVNRIDGGLITVDEIAEAVR
ncbi:MAG: pyruvate flavodoxin/ferredoxin oxidoreductase [Actinomycetota bacterium]|nr:pyruvate flavodoxin/ferredoxin oxidoreductase [Actinomycetota bacterium]